MILVTAMMAVASITVGNNTLLSIHSTLSWYITSICTNKDARVSTMNMENWPTKVMAFCFDLCAMLFAEIFFFISWSFYRKKRVRINVTLKKVVWIPVLGVYCTVMPLARGQGGL